MPRNDAVYNRTPGNFLKIESTCVCCGMQVPEGMIVCPNCMEKAGSASTNCEIKKTGNKRRLRRFIRIWGGQKRV